MCWREVYIIGIPLGSYKDDTLANGQQRVNVGQKLQLSALVTPCIDPQLLDNINDLQSVQ